MSMKQKVLFQFGDFRVDPLTRSLCRNDFPLLLNRRSFEVLLYLVQNPGRVIPKEELLKNVWPDVSVDETSLTQNISSLRKALQERPNEPSYISTVPGRGYQFIAPVTVLGPPIETALGEPSGATAHPNAYLFERRTVTTSTITESLHHSRLWSALLRRAAPVLLVAMTFLLGVAGYNVWRRYHSPPASMSIVVTDFLNSTGDATFDHTLRRALEVDLEQSPYMDVLSERNSVATLQRMGLNKETPITSDIGREICERTNHQVLLSGTVSSLGQRSLLMLEATDCNSGKSLVSAKAVADSKEHVLEALDQVADRVRMGLSESKQSFESYAVPIRDATTSSLDALRAYSMGMYLDSQGAGRSEILATFQHAIELDPQFAMAYRERGMNNSYLGQDAAASADYEKAYELRDHVSTQERMMIEATYYAQGQLNVSAGPKAYQLWQTTYPHDPVPAGDLVDVFMRLGQFETAAAEGENAAKRFPEYPLNFENLSTIYLALNRPGDAKAAALHAAEIGKGDTGLHIILFQIASAKDDQKALAAQDDWFERHENGSTVLYYPSLRGNAAAKYGRFHRAEDLFRASYEDAVRGNLNEAANSVLLDQAVAEAVLGYPAKARETLHRITDLGARSAIAAILAVRLGDCATGKRFLSEHSTTSTDTLPAYTDLPEVRAALAIANHKASDAIADLEAARPYEMRDYWVWTLRAAAYLAAGQPALAEHEYRLIVEHPGIDATSPLYPLARVGLAKSLMEQHKNEEAAKQLKALRFMLTNADSDLPMLAAMELGKDTN